VNEPVNVNQETAGGVLLAIVLQIESINRPLGSFAFVFVFGHPQTLPLN
jgi:hypothetical protein